jgi:phosphoribosylglycinamide formyltransferase-1
MIRVAVLISGHGSNLQALLDAATPALYQVAAVISNKPDVYGLARAASAGVPTYVLSHEKFPSRDAFDAELQRLIDSLHVDLIVLAGFMRILTADFARHYYGRLINIHPSLLPKFRGLNTHQRALDAGETEHGATVHFVVPELDAGPIIIQATVPILADDNAETLAARVLEQEHVIYPQAIRWFAEQRLRLSDSGEVLLDA